MSSLSRYHALYESLRSRQARPPVYSGLDKFVGRGIMKLKMRGITRSWLRTQAEAIDQLAPEIRSIPQAQLRERVEEMRGIFVRASQTPEQVRRGLSVIREVARRETGEEAYVVQLMGALALYNGRIIEMATGEGKTLTGSIAATLIAWKRRHLHVLTVNDYLASRDAESRASIYRFCGLSVGAIVQEIDERDRAEVYGRSIVYGTPKQITADWLRDQIRMGRVNTPWSGRQQIFTGAAEGPGSGPISGPMIPGLSAALVDEADAVLIDEGVVPLIIARSRRQDDMAEVYSQAAKVAAKLDEGPDYAVDHLRRRADLKRRGLVRAEQMWSEFAEPIWRASRRAEELVRQALIARHCYARGKQYEIVEGKVVIVDEYTGRFLPDRSWEHGLHQAVEAKEGLEVTADRETLARMSFQKFFRTYPFLAGMTGTAADATGEMEAVYQRPVMVIPTHRPVQRIPLPTRIFRDGESKWLAIADSVIEANRRGQPVLVGTRSIAASELMSRLLTEKGLEHKVLNANYDKEEATLIAVAGQGSHEKSGIRAAITVATNMAGRGTDIKPDRNALDSGGLLVILTEMHGAKRIDRQFMGRAGRQGDPGASQTFVSLQDEIILRHAHWAAILLSFTAGAAELKSRWWSRMLFRLAQRASEARDRRSREGVLRGDDWMEKYLPGT
jgi:preprotein translocase subunit SecA